MYRTYLEGGKVDDYERRGRVSPVGKAAGKRRGKSREKAKLLRETQVSLSQQSESKQDTSEAG